MAELDSEAADFRALPSRLPSGRDLVEPLRRLEGKPLEFRREFSGADGALKTIISFANTAGGQLLRGVQDPRRVQSTGPFSPSSRPGFDHARCWNGSRLMR